MLFEGEEEVSSACSCTVSTSLSLLSLLSLLLLFVLVTRLIGLKVGLKATGTAVTIGPRCDVEMGVTEVGEGD